MIALLSESKSVTFAYVEAFFLLISSSFRNVMLSILWSFNHVQILSPVKREELQIPSSRHLSSIYPNQLPTSSLGTYPNEPGAGVEIKVPYSPNKLTTK